MAAHAAGLHFEDFDAWSAGGTSYDPRAARDVWRSFKDKESGIGPGTLFAMAKERGHSLANGRHHASHRPHAASGTLTSRPSPAEIFARFAPATADHPYIKAKQGIPEGLRVVPEGDPLRVAGESMVGALVIPVGACSTLQLVTVGDTAARLMAAGRPAKLNLPGHSLKGWFTVGDMAQGGDVYVCEGIGQAWACWKATGRAAVVTFGAGRLRTVATQIKQDDPSAGIVLVPDVGKEEDAATIAGELGCKWVTMPAGWPPNSDVNDLALRDGHDALEEILAAPMSPPPPAPELDFVMASDLPDHPAPVEQIVEGLLGRVAMSILYGDSNSGKTFLWIDLACAVASGSMWMDRQTVQGLVIYLATEAPRSVITRLQAYHKHFRTKVPHLAVVQSPIDLFDGTADASKVVRLIQSLEREHGLKCLLVIGDTLARMAAGANENSGEDMGSVIRHAEHIRREAQVHVSLIHHSGKDQARGARGWSGLRAAIDTEIEVTGDDATGMRAAEITKQRDMGGKGTRIGFRLETVDLGPGQWDSRITSCVVLPADAPPKVARGKRPSEVAGAIAELLTQHGTGMRKADIVKHFAERYERATIYRELKKMAESGRLNETIGIYSLRLPFIVGATA